MTSYGSARWLKKWGLTIALADPQVRLQDLDRPYLSVSHGSANNPVASLAEPLVRAAGITAGGVIPNPPPAAAYPSTTTAEKIRKPFGIIHGELDTTVPPWTSELLKDILDANDVPNFRLVVPDVGHPVNTQKPEIVFPLLQEWFKEHGVLAP